MQNAECGITSYIVLNFQNVNFLCDLSGFAARFIIGYIGKQSKNVQSASSASVIKKPPLRLIVLLSAARAVVAAAL